MNVALKIEGYLLNQSRPKVNRKIIKSGPKTHEKDVKRVRKGRPKIVERHENIRGARQK